MKLAKKKLKIKKNLRITLMKTVIDIKLYNDINIFRGKDKVNRYLKKVKKDLQTWEK